MYYIEQLRGIWFGISGYDKHDFVEKITLIVQAVYDAYIALQKEMPPSVWRHFLQVETRESLSVSTPFRIQFVSIKSSGPSAAEHSKPNSTASADQSANQSSGPGCDPNIDQISVAAIKARPFLGRIASHGITRRCPANRSRSRSSAVFAFACLRFGRKRQRYGKHEKRERDN